MFYVYMVIGISIVNIRLTYLTSNMPNEMCFDRLCVRLCISRNPRKMLLHHLGILFSYSWGKHCENMKFLSIEKIIYNIKKPGGRVRFEF